LEDIRRRVTDLDDVLRIFVRTVSEVVETQAVQGRTLMEIHAAVTSVPESSPVADTLKILVDAVNQQTQAIDALRTAVGKLN
jgi:hypothetical protein